MFIQVYEDVETSINFKSVSDSQENFFNRYDSINLKLNLAWCNNFTIQLSILYHDNFWAEPDLIPARKLPIIIILLVYYSSMAEWVKSQLIPKSKKVSRDIYTCVKLRKHL